MPFDGSGNFTRVRNWSADSAANIKIRSDYHDSEDNGFANAFNNVICRDGQAPILNDIPWNAKKITNLADPVNPQDAATQHYVTSYVTGLKLAPLTAEHFNRIVNGAMQVSQENGNTGGTTNNYFAADQWAALVTGIVVNSARGVITTTTPYYIAMSVTTAKPALAAGDFIGFMQNIEGARVSDLGWGAAGAKQIVVRFDAYSTVAGTYYLFLRNGANNYSGVWPFTLPAATWTTITLVIPGPTAGTWAIDNTTGISVGFTTACGTTYTAAATGWQAGNFLSGPGATNGAATTPQSFQLRNVGLYVDPNNTGIAPAWQMPDAARELLDCKRYWCPLDNVARLASIDNGGSRGGEVYLQVPMRVLPTVGAASYGTAWASGPTWTMRPSVQDVWGTVAVTTTQQWVSNATFNARM